MKTSDLFTENINEKALIALMEKGKVDLAILKSRNLATIENLEFLFLLDRITVTELASYRNLSRSTIYRHVIKEHRTTIVQTRIVDENYKTIAVSPRNVFENIYDYEEFLKWRSEERNGRRSISLTDAMAITGLTRRQLHILIKKEKLVAIRKRSGAFEVLESSLELFLIGYLIDEKKRMEKAVEFLNSRGNGVSINLHLREICI